MVYFNLHWWCETLIRLVDSVRARMASKCDDVFFVEHFFGG